MGIVGSKVYNLTKKQRIDAFVALGRYLASSDEQLQAAIFAAGQQNPWFTEANVRLALDAISELLTADRLESWLAPYPFDGDIDKTVGLVLAGNIPLVGFHDILCTLCAGFNAQIKPSGDDRVLITHVVDKLAEIAPAFKSKIALVDQLKAFDLTIATGSDNSARYFTYYFGRKPHIIRKNRNSVAVLTGEESAESFRGLGHDIFDYFGMGCRSVSKLFVPSGYDIAAFFEGIQPFADVILNHRYANNYDYYKSIFLINGDDHRDNGFLLVKPDERSASPLSVLYLEEYASTDKLTDRLMQLAPGLQCVVSTVPLAIPTPVILPGLAQRPALDDYADGVNTLDFLAGHR